ncbi:hypothetical protein AU255_14255 [Methyloprofundus sedimenti]|uniref:Antitoxin n=1 Tax=Methyloprofundus sedimenti TaxID=1420851 RepID=A0A1V8M3W8_9GAMM|nr:type II toxin-antitoxin system Phd/YefM family antitoxin [Methyloprofundus sedimenti]OQK16254.1 hypothetical protein AU255_14255 [Methyloprofundus sedimenti]
MNPRTNISDAKVSLSQLIKIVQETNEPIIIGKTDNPVAILFVFKESPSPRKLGGSWKVKVEIWDNFDESADELSDHFCNSVIFPDKK